MTHTNAEVRKAIEEVVAEGGEDHVYKGVRNTKHKKAANLGYSYDDCIVGCVIRKLEPELHDKMLSYERGATNSFALNARPGHLAGDIDAAFTQKQRVALFDAQNAQDAGKPWGVALKAFNETIGATK